MTQKYIDQLLDDLAEASEKKVNYCPGKKSTGSHVTSFQEVISQVELFVNGPMYKLSEIVGIDLSLLPPDDLLSDEQTRLLAPKMEHLLNVFNFFPDFPCNAGKVVPPRLRYRAMRNSWETEQVIVTTGEIHLEFCNYEEDDCPFPGFCNICSKTQESDALNLIPDTDIPGFIPSIFNYCDRWCERCTLTDKCMTFAMVKELERTTDNTEKSMDGKLQDIETGLSDSLSGKNLEKSDFNNFPDFENPEDPCDIFTVGYKSAHHPIALLSFDYFERSHLWLKSITKICRREFVNWLANGNADQILNAIEILSWYHYFLYPKIRRALSGYYEMEEDDYAEADMNGSAKITLIGIDRSIDAFTILDNQMPSQKTDISEHIGLLVKLRNKIELTFPNARNFIRPGLDE